MAFPTNTPPRQHGNKAIQSPPKRVDELMSELADFDPSIQPSDIAEPMPTRAGRPVNNLTSHNRHYDERESGRQYNYQKSPSPVRHAKQVSFKFLVNGRKVYFCNYSPALQDPQSIIHQVKCLHQPKANHHLPLPPKVKTCFMK
jgi:hypothetical protein